MTDWNGLRERLSGVWLPGDDEYEALRPKYELAGAPAVFVRPETTDEITQALRFAAAESMPVSIRSGGHGASAFPNPGGIVIDLGRFDSIDIEDGGRVRIGGGATWGVVAETLEKHNLGLSSGDTREVGVGGLTLGGGIGWMVRERGLALDQLEGVELVTATGEVVTANEQTNSELFWALRGGGGNFGVVTEFTFRAHPLSGVVAGSITLDPDRLAEVVRAWRDVMRSAPEQLNVTLVSFPSFGPDVPPGAQLLVCYAGTDQAAADAAVAPLLSLPGAGASTIGPKRYSEVLEEAVPPPPATIVGENGFVPELSDDAIDALIATRVAMLPSVLMIRSLGGEFSRVPADATAFAHRDAEVWTFIGSFLPLDASAEAVAETASHWSTVSEYVTGTYGNFRQNSSAEIVARIYPGDTAERLLAVKREWDSQNVFRVNHNFAVPA
jgi:FAD/FMN-containing dehydrogenase